MAKQIYDDAFFLAERHRLLGHHRVESESSKGRRFRLPAAIARGAALDCAPGEVTVRALSKLAPRHATAARAHMAFYQASLQATALVPAHDLVQAAVQIEWLWYSTPFKGFYRDHLAHVLKVTTIALHALEDPRGLLAPIARAGEAPGLSLGKLMAEGKVGSPILRQAARRLGVSRQELEDENFWYEALRETLQIAGLLHDMAYPAMLSSYLRRAARAADPLSPFEPDHAEATGKTFAAIDDTLVAAIFDGDVGNPLDFRALQPVCEYILQKSHSLQAGANLLHYRRIADRTWRLSPLEAFAIEWAARAATLHDFDKVWEYAPGCDKAGQSVLTDWLKTPEQLRAIRPTFAADPASYLLAFADQVQDFGRLHYQKKAGKPGRKIANHLDDASLLLSYPCRSVALEVVGRNAELRWRFDPFQVPFGVPKETQKFELERKQKDARKIFGEPDKVRWLDHSGLFDAVVIA